MLAYGVLDALQRELVNAASHGMDVEAMQHALEFVAEHIHPFVAVGQYIRDRAACLGFSRTTVAPD
jgi:hypothetical protein